MEHPSIIAAIDAEIGRLEQVRKLLADPGSTGGGVVRRAAKLTTRRKKRTLSPEARKRIADAQRKRWASHKKLAALSAIGKTARKAAKKQKRASGVPF